MNGYDVFMLAIVAFAAAIALLPVLAWLRLRAVERSVASLADRLDLYAEASIRVADAVSADRAQRAEPSFAAESSRRAVLKRARIDLDAGKSPRRTAKRFGLRRDERALIDAARRASKAA